MPSFRLFGIPVTVQPTFLLIAVALAWFSGSTDWRFVVTWIVVIFVSIIVHELGHALVARSYGATVAIELNGLGGLTRWGVPEGDLPPGRRAMVAAAGSAVGLAFGGIVWGLSLYFGPFDEPVVRLAVRLLVFVNVFWGLLNWLPIRPLDGGHLLMSLLTKVIPDRAETWGRVIFMVTSAIALFFALRMDLIFLAILSGWMLISEFTSGSRSTVGIPQLDYEELPREDPFPAAEPEPDLREQRDDGAER